MSIWKKFAEQNNLTYKRWLFLGNEYVTGYYHGYRFRLELIHRKKSSNTTQVFTRMVLSVDKSAVANLGKKRPIPDYQLDEKDLVSLLVPTTPQDVLTGRIYASSEGQEIAHEQEEVMVSLKRLQFLLDLLKNLIEVYPVVVGLGGEVAPLLQTFVDRKAVLRPIAGQLLYDIGKETEKRLKPCMNQWWCPDCLTHCSAHPVQVHWIGSFYYYGCRACNQSRRLVELTAQRVIAVLNQALTVEQLQQDIILRVNWLIRHRLFDFDEVEIVQATDEEVERFAIQVGNDNDPVRQPRYRQMCCAISPACGLSENTLRILHKMFGKVEVKPI